MVDIPGHESDTDVMRVLHLDDDPDLTEMTEMFLKREIEGLEVICKSSPDEAIETVRQSDVDCIVSDYEMPDMDGLEFLDEVRENHEELPFILFTGRGSEEIASEAISRGVTDYLQKERGTDQYTVLANRIQNAVSKSQAEQEIERRSNWYEQILKHSSDYVMIVDGMGKVSYVSPAVERVMGYTPEELIGQDSFENIHPDDLEFAASALAETISNPEQEVTVEFRSIAKDDSIKWLEARGRNFLDDQIIKGVMVNVRDITERKNREQALARQKDHLQDLTRFLHHDVRNQLAVMNGYIELARSAHDLEELDGIAASLTRIEDMIEKVGKLAQSGQEITEVEPIRLEDIVRECWKTAIGTQTAAELSVDSDLQFMADPERLRTLLENLLGNAVEHAAEDPSIHVGRLEEKHGFYLEDDGPGIPEDEVGQIFEPEYTTSDTGTGLGLVIVGRIADAHEWEIEVKPGSEKGTRLEISNVEPVENH